MSFLITRDNIEEYIKEKLNTDTIVNQAKVIANASGNDPYLTARATALENAHKSAVVTGKNVYRALEQENTARGKTEYTAKQMADISLVKAKSQLDVNMVAVNNNYPTNLSAKKFQVGQNIKTASSALNLMPGGSKSSGGAPKKRRTKSKGKGKK